MMKSAFAAVCGMGGAWVGLYAHTAEAQVLDTSFTVQNAVDTLAVFQQVVAVQAFTAEQTTRRLGAGPDAPGHSGAGSWNVWGGGSGVVYDFDTAGFDGDGFSAIGGIDHLLADDLLVGFAIGYDRTAFETTLLGTPGDFDGQSYTFNFYGGWAPADNLVVDAFFSYTRTNLDIDQGTAEGDTTSDRASGGIGLTGTYAFGPVVVQPRVAAAVAFDSQITYFDSNGNDIPNERSAVFRGIGGARLSYPLSFGAAELRPWAQAEIEGTLDDVGDVALLGDTFSGRFGAGMDMVLSDWVVTLSGGVAGVGGRDFTEYGGRVQVAYPF